MDLSLRGKAVLVTGGSRGIGREIALTFAAEGADVAICARNDGPIQKTVKELRDHGVRAVGLSADLFQAEDCRRVVDDTAKEFGRLDILINNASTVVSGTVQGDSDDRLMERVAGKTLAAIRCSRAALPYMKQAGAGRIICIGGSASRESSPGHLAQGLGNSSVSNFTKFLSDEVAPEHILVNVIHPYFCKTDRYPARLTSRAQARGISEAEMEAQLAAAMPIRRLLEPADIAPLVVFLCSPLASGITGQSIAVDGGAIRSIVY